MNRAPGNSITDDDVRANGADGVVCLRQMFDSEWPDLPTGAYPDYDALFPIVWEQRS